MLTCFVPFVMDTRVGYPVANLHLHSTLQLLTQWSKRCKAITKAKQSSFYVLSAVLTSTLTHAVERTERESESVADRGGKKQLETRTRAKCNRSSTLFWQHKVTDQT